MTVGDEERFAPANVLRRLQPFMEAHTGTALLQLLQSLALFGGGWLLAAALPSHAFPLLSWAPFLAGTVLVALCKVRLFVQFHDMGHGSFFPSLAWNRFFGHFVGSLVNTPFDSWKTPHSTHHVHLAKVDRNEEQHGEVPTWKVADFKKASGIARFLYRLYRTPFVMFVVLPQYVFSLSYRWQPDSLICNTLIALRCAILFLINPSLLWVEFWATFLSNSIGFYLFFGQHTFNPFMEQTHANYNVVKAGIYSSSFFVMHPILHWFSANIGYHHVHHTTVRIPSYQLVKAHHATLDLWTDVTRVTFADVWANSALILWDDDLHKYVTFEEVAKNMALEGEKKHQ